MDTPAASHPDDALGQPTRARLFSLLGELKRPAGTAELADRLDLHPNGVRVHLERLEEAGLVVRQRERQVRGRPRDAWTIAPDARPGGEPPEGYADLSRWLARVIQSGPTGLRRAERAGREIGRDLAPVDQGATGAQRAIAISLTALGFQPDQTDDGAGHVTYCLGNCPYRDAVRENQQLVCTLHRGITLGLLDRLAPGARLTDFSPRDPDRAGCLIELDHVPD